jgi:hypothetical protein
VGTYVCGNGTIQQTQAVSYTGKRLMKWKPTFLFYLLSNQRNIAVCIQWRIITLWTYDFMNLPPLLGAGFLDIHIQYLHNYNRGHFKRVFHLNIQPRRKVHFHVVAVVRQQTHPSVLRNGVENCLHTVSRYKPELVGQFPVRSIDESGQPPKMRKSVVIAARHANA